VKRGKKKNVLVAYRARRRGKGKKKNVALDQLTRRRKTGVAPLDPRHEPKGRKKGGGGPSP